MSEAKKDVRRSMVSAARGGCMLREVARRFRVSLSTVQLWVSRAGDQRLDRVDWSDHRSGPRQSPSRTSEALEERILQLRASLKVNSDLGEYGAAAIQRELFEQGIAALPCERTIHRVLERHGKLDVQRRKRRPAPPCGWYLPEVANGSVELDQADIVTGLVIVGGIEVETFNIVSLHGGLVGSFPSGPIRAADVAAALLAHWREHGMPGFIQFDNDTRFLGPSNRPDILGAVVRMCLGLEVTPVFAPPRETGFQAAVEGYNALWQDKVWDRQVHASLDELLQVNRRYVNASHGKRAQRIEAAPTRRALPARIKKPWDHIPAMPSGRVVFIRRTDDSGNVNILGRTWNADPNWPHRLVRCDLDLDADCIRILRLRRAQPEAIMQLNEHVYHFPKKKFVPAKPR